MPFLEYLLIYSTNVSTLNFLILRRSPGFLLLCPASAIYLEDIGQTICVCVCPGYEMYLRHSSYFLRSTVPQLLCDPSRPFIFWTSVMFLTDDIRQESREPNSEPGLSSQSLELHPCTVWVTAFKSRGKNLLVGYWMFAEQHISLFNCCHENELLNRR